MIPQPRGTKPPPIGVRPSFQQLAENAQLALRVLAVCSANIVKSVDCATALACCERESGAWKWWK